MKNQSSLQGHKPIDIHNNSAPWARQRHSFLLGKWVSHTHMCFNDTPSFLFPHFQSMSLNCCRAEYKQLSCTVFVFCFLLLFFQYRLSTNFGLFKANKCFLLHTRVDVTISMYDGGLLGSFLFYSSSAIAFPSLTPCISVIFIHNHFNMCSYLKGTGTRVDSLLCGYYVSLSNC